MIQVQNPAKLRHCPECGSDWPAEPDFALRSCGWLYGLPHRITPSNSDIEIHDGWHGRDRFLRLELKGPRETWPLQKGQLSFLVALSRLDSWTVRVLRGLTNKITVYRVSPSGIEATGITTHAEAIRRAVAAWVNGTPWRLIEDSLPTLADDTTHTHGWARASGVWTCVQDHYAVGFAPSTGCGETLPHLP